MVPEVSHVDANSKDFHFHFIKKNDDEDEECGQGFNPSHCKKSSPALDILYAKGSLGIFPRNVGFLFSSSMPWGGKGT